LVFVLQCNNFLIKNKEKKLIYKYQELSSTKLNELIDLDPVIFVPNSPIEVHGPHLPLGADIIQAENLAVILAEEGNKKYPERPWIIFPVIPIGADPLPLNGSINYSFFTLVDVLKATANGLLMAGIKSIVFTNFHGGMRHILAQDIAADYVNRKGGKSFAPFGILFGEFLQKEFNDEINDILAANGVELVLDGEVHAGALETSLLLAIGSKIDDSLYKDLKPLRFTDEAVEIASIMAMFKNSLGIFSKDIESFFGDMEMLFQASTHFKKYSYSGDPARANIEIGKLLFKTYTAKLAEKLEEFVLSEKITGDNWKSVFWKNRKIVNEKAFDLIFSQILGNK
jgi:creatinine amidohydrolase